MPLAAAVLIWFFVIGQQLLEWSTNEQYFYGWAIPLLCIYLFLQRWPDRPPPRPGQTSFRVATFLFLVCLIPWAPLRFVQEANPDWRMVNWVSAITGVLFTMALIGRLGGRPWVRHFLFPVAFFLVAVPWPTFLEKGIMERLMLFNAMAAAEFLSLLGVPNVREGSIIAIAAGKVGVEEACSGIFSLQTSIMMALFLGEFHRLRIPRRLALLAGGVVAASAFNVGRTLFLVMAAARQGIAAVENYHDTVGYFVLGATLVSLWILSLFLQARQEKPAFAQPERLRGVIPIPCRRTALHCSLVIAMVGLVDLSKEAWYRHQGRDLEPHPGWSLQTPVERQDLRMGEIPPGTKAILRYNEAMTVSWRSATGLPASVFYFRWEPGRTAAQLAGATVRTFACLWPVPPSWARMAPEPLKSMGFIWFSMVMSFLIAAGLCTSFKRFGKTSATGTGGIWRCMI